LGLTIWGWAFWPSLPVRTISEKIIGILKVNLSSQNLYHIIKSFFKCSKQTIPPEVEASTSGYFKNKFQILNFQCLKSSLLLKCFTWNWYILLTLEIFWLTSNNFQKGTSGNEIWSCTVQNLLFHFLRNCERWSHEIFSDDRPLHWGVQLWVEKKGFLMPKIIFLTDVFKLK
jgi:hypothetical protein